MKPFIKIKKPKDRKNMNWAEAKWTNPKLKPMGDWDNDGVKNQFDCRPLNRKRQHLTLEEKLEMIRADKEGFKKKARAETRRLNKEARGLGYARGVKQMKEEGALD